MLASHAGLFSDDEVLHFSQNDHREEIPELLAVVAHLGRDQRVAIVHVTQAASAKIAIPSELASEWEKFWQAEYSIKADFAGLQIPVPPVGYAARLLVMHEKGSQAPEMLFQSDKKAYGGKVWKFTNGSLDEAVPTHKIIGTFGAWVADVQEAPDGGLGKTSLINLSTEAVDELGWVTETLPLRQVHGRKFFRERGEHLDKTVVTVAAGSRDADGRVPRVYCNDDGWVNVYYWLPGNANGDLRFRRAIV